MSTLALAVNTFIRELLVREDGQDLVEYALIASMITFGSVTGMGVLASGINNVFSDVAVSLASNL